MPRITGAGSAVSDLNIDFSLLQGLTQFNSACTIYTLILALTLPGTIPHTGVVPATPSIPPLTPTQSDYVIVAENSQTPPDDAFAAMDELYAYFDEHRADIATLHAQNPRQFDGASAVAN